MYCWIWSYNENEKLNMQLLWRTISIFISFSRNSVFLQSKPKWIKNVKNVNSLFEFCFRFAPFSRQQFEFLARSSSHLSLPKIASFLQNPNNFQPNGFKFFQKGKFFFQSNPIQIVAKLKVNNNFVKNILEKFSKCCDLALGLWNNDFWD